MVALDDLCIWNKVLTDQTGTTFQVVEEYRAQGKAHPLVRCMFCTGYRYDCRDYRFVHEGRVHGGKR